MPIIDIADAKEQLNILASDTSQDAELQVFVDATTIVVEREASEVIEQRTVVDELNLDGSTAFRLWSVPVISLTSVQSVDGATTWDVANLHVSKTTGLVRVLSGPAVSGLVEVTYEAGYAADDVPEHYQLAARFIVQDLWRSQRGTMEVTAGGLPETTPSVSVAVITRGYLVPRFVKELLGATQPVVA